MIFNKVADSVMPVIVCLDPVYLSRYSEDSMEAVMSTAYAKEARAFATKSDIGEPVIELWSTDTNKQDAFMAVLCKEFQH